MKTLTRKGWLWIT